MTVQTNWLNAFRFCPLILLALGSPPTQTASGQPAEAAAYDLTTIERQVQTAYEEIAPTVVRITYNQLSIGTDVNVPRKGHLVVIACRSGPGAFSANVRFCPKRRLPVFAESGHLNR